VFVGTTNGCRIKTTPVRGFFFLEQELQFDALEQL
jgi:hypothetical protein